MCKFEKTCSCATMVSYAENMIHDQMICGLVEPIIQEKALSHVEDSDSLKKSMSYIDTLEKAKHDTLILAGPGGLNRQGTRPAKTEAKGGDQSKVVCWGCGARGHWKWTSSCPAKDKGCLGCKKKGYFKA